MTQRRLNQKTFLGAFAGIAMVSILIFVYSEYCDYNYCYTKNDIYCDYFVQNETFDVSDLKIRKEKNKPDRYDFTLHTIVKPDAEFANSLFDLQTSLNQSQYEKIIGIGNNSISSQIYSLELVVPAKYHSVYYSYYIQLIRYSCFGEKDFTVNEINEIAALSLNTFALENKSCGNNDNLSQLKKYANCMQVYAGGTTKKTKEMKKLSSIINSMR